MKILKIDQSIGVADAVYVLSQQMKGIEKFASTQPLHQALVDLSNLLSNHIKWALCGGLAVGVRANPRGTKDVDIIIENDSIIDDVERLTRSLFKHNRLHALVHKKLGVEVDLVTPEHVKVDSHVVSTAISTATIVNLGGVSVPVITQEGLIALKLGRGSDYDIGDIKAVIKKSPNVDLSQYNLNEKEKNLFEKIKKQMSNEVTMTEKELD